MNVIFLDIDGVMNHRKFMVRSKVHSSYAFCPEAVEYVKRILERTDAKIVVSSSWRIGETVESLQELFSHYGLDNFVVGLTPFSGNFNEMRGEEIQQYMDAVKGTEREVESFVIIDDDKDMAHLMWHLIHCKNYSGLSKTRMNEAIIKMKEQTNARQKEVSTQVR